MAKKKASASLFECQHCGMQSPKWMGKCSNCGSWDSFIELNAEQIKTLQSVSDSASGEETRAKPITEFKEDEVERFSSGEPEFDLVLGGGIVPGSLTLIGGSPGVGKSTLLLKISGEIAKSGKQVLYVTGEESGGQVRMRASRLGSLNDKLYLLPEIRLEKMMQEFHQHAFSVLVIDSIQTAYTESVTSAPGSVSQVREITFELMRLAKVTRTAVFIIGHITKEGSIAGPRILEHMVDTVLYFEGDSSREVRMLRGFKNRFGATSEIGIFEMKEEGLVSAKSIFSKFYESGTEQPGSAITVIMEGSRALVLEVQALVSEAYGNPKRSATGFDSNRLNMLLALLEKKLELPFNQYDVFINIAGGIKITETSADLAVIAAILSSFRSRPVSRETVFIGEVSLVGDIRDVSQIDIRLKEAKMQGFERAVIPKKIKNAQGMKVFAADEVNKIIEWM